MNKRILIAIATILVLGLSIAAFALTRTGDTHNAMSCCGDSCPMKSKDAKAGETASCCDKCDCCGGDSCPMKANGEKMNAMHSASGKAASCPMMKAESATATTVDMKDVTVAKDGESCSCSCCGKDKEKKDVPAV